MYKTACCAALLMVLSMVAPGQAQRFMFKKKLAKVNLELAGSVLDFTQNHGSDNRIWSNALCSPRDLYVYLPPGYDADKRYPILLWLHGFLQDERSFVDGVVQRLDAAIACGLLPPMIVAAPDGSIHGHVDLLTGNSFFLNSNAGNFEDYLIQDVWNFLVSNFPIHPDRRAHALSGMSMGGFAAYNISFKYRETFGVAAGFIPPLNLRWTSCRNRYFRNFDPCCWGWRTEIRHGCETIGRFWCGLVRVPIKMLVGSLYGKDPNTINYLSFENPIEMLERLRIQPGEFEMFIGYARRDEFNIDAQVESFLYAARCRGIDVSVVYDPRGRHNMDTVLVMFPQFIHWLAPRFAPFHPDAVVETASEPGAAK